MSRMDAVETLCARVAGGHPPKPEELEGNDPEEGKALPRKGRSPDMLHWDDANGSPIGQLLGIHDEVRRLRMRLAYLERCVPPDVQRALLFFEPLPLDQHPGEKADPSSHAKLHEDVNQAKVVAGNA